MKTTPDKPTCRLCGAHEDLRAGVCFNCAEEAEKNTTGVEWIAYERKRQVEQEGWTPGHDDEHEGGEMLDAAKSYIEVTKLIDRCAWNNEDVPPSSWPWDEEWFKPKAPIVNLIRAGALIAAEIDRRLRAGETLDD